MKSLRNSLTHYEFGLNRYEPVGQKKIVMRFSSFQKESFISKSRNGKVPFHISMQKKEKMEVNLNGSRTIHAPRESLHRIAERHLSLREKDTEITPETESVRHYFRGMKYGTWA